MPVGCWVHIYDLAAFRSWYVTVRTKAKSSTQVDAESTVGQRRRPNGDSSKAKPATSTAAADRQRSSTVTKTASATSAATKRTTRKVQASLFYTNLSHNILFLHAQWVISQFWISLSLRPKTETKRLKFGLSPELRLTNRRSTNSLVTR